MKIAVIGGGPAGLYFAISMKLRDPAHEVHVFERNPRGVTFGWGVVFSDQTLENLTANLDDSRDGWEMVLGTLGHTFRFASSWLRRTSR